MQRHPTDEASGEKQTDYRCQGITARPANKTWRPGGRAPLIGVCTVLEVNTAQSPGGTAGLIKDDLP